MLSKLLKSCLVSALFAGAQAFAAGPAPAAIPEHGSKAEAQEMVKKALALIKSAGPEAAYKTFTEHPNGAFKDRDLYVFVYDFQGNCLAQGANPKMVGRNFIELKDIEGRELLKDQVKMIKAKNSGWYGPYKFNNPVTNKVDTKEAYCERGVGDTYLCVGAYSSSN